MNNRDNIIKCGSLGLKMFLLQTILVMESGYIYILLTLRQTFMTFDENQKLMLARIWNMILSGVIIVLESVI